jgi:hypothetical protein
VGGPLSYWQALDKNETFEYPASVQSYIFAGGLSDGTAKDAEIRFNSLPIEDRTVQGSFAWFYARTGANTTLQANVICLGCDPTKVTVPANSDYAWHSIAVTPAGQDGVNDIRLHFAATGNHDASAAAAYFELQLSPCAPAYGNFMPGIWPTACYRPYADNSPFNTPLPTSLPPETLFDPNSQLMVNRIIYEPYFAELPPPRRAGNLEAPASGLGGWPTYYPSLTDSVYKIVECNEYFSDCPIRNMQLHLTPGAERQGGAQAPAGWDRHMTTIDQENAWEYDFYHFGGVSGGISSVPPPNQSLEVPIGWGGRTRIDGDGLRSYATASGFGNLAGRIREEELARAVSAKTEIHHAITIAISCGDNDSVYPAGNQADYLCSRITNPNTLERLSQVNAAPMGTRFMLDVQYANTVLPSLPLWQQAAVKAMVKYGLFMNDTGSAFAFSSQAESGNQYTSVGVTYQDPWFPFGRDNGWTLFAGDYVGHLGDGVDWSNLRVVNPCVTEGICSGQLVSP